jgi:hypothetical protein
MKYIFSHIGLMSLLIITTLTTLITIIRIDDNWVENFMPIYFGVVGFGLLFYMVLYAIYDWYQYK